MVSSVRFSSRTVAPGRQCCLYAVVACVLMMLLMTAASTNAEDHGSAVVADEFVATHNTSYQEDSKDQPNEEDNDFRGREAGATEDVPPIPLPQWAPPIGVVKDPDRVIMFDVATREESVVAAAEIEDMLARSGSSSGYTPIGGVVGQAEDPEQAGLKNFTALTRIYNTEDYPWRVNVRLIMYFSDGVNDGTFQGSGVLIDGIHVITAGHCVHSGAGGDWADSIRVQPAYDHGLSSYGEASSSMFTSWVGWTVNSLWEHDMGIIRLGRPMGGITGWHGYGWNSNDAFFTSTTFNNPNYPGTSHAGNGQEMWYWYGTYDTVFTEIVYFFSQGYGGQSGSGGYVIDGSNRYVYTVLSHGTDGTDAHTGCTRITSGKFSSIQSIIANNTPSTLDLAALYVQAGPSTITAGNELTSFSYVVYNNSSAYVSVAVPVGFYLSTNDNISTSDLLLQNRVLHHVFDPKSTLTVTLSSNLPLIPIDVPEGDYYVGIILDIADYNTGNNDSDGWDAYPITVTCPQVATPTGFSCTAGCGYIDLSWNTATNATGYRIYRDGSLLASVAGTSYRDNSPGASQRCYRVAGYNSCDESTQSAQSCCTALFTPPTPTGFSCTAGCGFIDLSWSASSGATSYRVYRGGALLTTIAGTSYRDNSPGASQQCYTVRAGNVCGLSTATGQSCCTALTIPPALSSLVCTPLCGAISLDWSPSAGATSYWVYRDGSFLLTVSGSGFQDNSPGSGERCYHVTAVNVCGESGDSPRACCTALGTPEPPVSLSCTPGCGYIDLAWSASAGATLYRVYRDDIAYSSTASTSWRDNSPGTTEHCYTVTAENACGASAHSPQACCTALSVPPKVNGLQATTTVCDTIKLRWMATPGATGYRVYRDGAGLASVPLTSYADYIGFDACYEYAVTALNDCGEGPPSDPATGCSECAPTEFSISGNMVYYDMVKHVPDVTVDLTGGAIATTMSDVNGYYEFGGLSSGDYVVSPYRLDDDDGVSIADVVKIRRHLAFLERFDSPYKYLAGDVTCDGGVSVSDVIKIRRYLAQLDPLPCGNWVFVDSSFAINDANWFSAPQTIMGALSYDWTDSSFVGIRFGDVNNTWAPPGPAVADTRLNSTQSAGGATVSVTTERDVIAGDLVNVQVEANSAGLLSGVELHLNYAVEELTFVNVSSSSVSNYTANGGDGEIHLVWEDLNNPVDATDAADLFTLRLHVAGGMTDSGEITISGEIVDILGEPYSASWQSGWVVLASPNAMDPDNELVPGSFYLSANYPNPFNPETNIAFGLPRTSYVTLCVYNIVGQRVNCIASGEYAAGDHQVVWNGRDEAGDLVGSGVYFYRLDAGEFTQTRKMTFMK